MPEQPRSSPWLRRLRIFFRELGWLIGQIAMYLFRALRSLIGWIRVRRFKGSASVESERRHERSTAWRALSPLRRAVVRAAVLLLCAVAILFAARRVERQVSTLGADRPQAATPDAVESSIKRSAQDGAVESEQTANATRSMASSTPTPNPADLGDWKLSRDPVLAPGLPGEWDDFAIASASVVRLSDKWLMLYEGVALGEDGRSNAFGAAESPDGVKWKKRPENPVFNSGAHDWEIVTAPCVTKWQEGWIALYVANRALTLEEKSLEELNLPRRLIRLACSSDGVNWEDGGEIKAISFTRTKHAARRPCIYSDASLLHLWWIGESEQGPALFHSTSRDGEEWSKASSQLTKEIDTREVACARVQPSGDYYLLTYVAFDEKNGPRLVTKVSQNARTWTANGPPEFPLPAYFLSSMDWQQPVPSVVFMKEGARLFYIDILFPKNVERPHPTRDAARGAVLRTAFCPKQNAPK